VLKRFGFVNVRNEKSEKISHSPIYAALEITPSEMRRFFARIFGSISLRWSDRPVGARPAQAIG